ncbi:sensor histidine kinase [Thiomicrolovo sp. ZZH C-3]
MFSERSIRNRFLIQLIVASAALLIIFSSILYFYIRQNIYDEKQHEMLQFAKNITEFQSLSDTMSNDTDALLGVTVELIRYDVSGDEPRFFDDSSEGRDYLILLYPFEQAQKTYLKVSKDISTMKKLLKKILRSIFIINAIGFFIIVLYAIALSKMLTIPIRQLSHRLANMNEHLVRPIRVEHLPEEFEPLGLTINRLLARIQNFVKYQKELFIGAAHELKTPLAVIKLKNQVTLIKKRSPEEYIEAIKKTNETVDEMNKIVADILNIGRQEGAQLEAPVRRDIIDMLRRKGEDFALLARAEQKTLTYDFQPESYEATIQEGLLNQILQNFLQNAVKFTPEGRKVTFTSRAEGEDLIIRVVDEGCGIDDSVDLFAPFKRLGTKSGVGLGLFLAKSAADAMGAEISLRNRTDGIDGTEATLVLRAKLCCPLPQHKKK